MRIVIKKEEFDVKVNGIKQKVILPITCSRKEYKNRYGKEALDNLPEEIEFQLLKKQEELQKAAFNTKKQFSHIQLAPRYKFPKDEEGKNILDINGYEMVMFIPTKKGISMQNIFELPKQIKHYK